MKILEHRELGKNEHGITVTKKGGENDGETFRSVMVHLEDDSAAGAFMSNVRPGYFKQVFVPWDFTHKEIIE
jgi:hypothetical protein